MNLDQWRDKIYAHVQALARQVNSLTPGLVYGAVAGASILPLVAAARDGSVPWLELAGLLGNLGANLLGNELANWKHRSDDRTGAGNCRQS